MAHLMETVNQKAASRYGKTVFGKEVEQADNGSKTVAEDRD